MYILQRGLALFALLYVLVGLFGGGMRMGLEGQGFGAFYPLVLGLGVAGITVLSRKRLPRQLVLNVVFGVALVGAIASMEGVLGLLAIVAQGNIDEPIGAVVQAITFSISAMLLYYVLVAVRLEDYDAHLRAHLKV